MLQWLKSLIFTFWMLLSVVFYAAAIFLAALFSHKAGFALGASYGRQLRRALRWLCDLDFEVIGEENVPDEAAIYYVKHSSTMETFMELAFIPQHTWVLKRSLIFIPIFGWALIAMKPIAINRGAGGSAVQQVIRQGKQRLADGINIVIFPEGTRVRYGETKRWGKSGAALAKEANALVVPVAHNAGLFWPRRGVYKHPGKVTFVIGKPQRVGDRTAGQFNEELSAWVEAEIAKMPGRERKPKASAPS